MPRFARFGSRRFEFPVPGSVHKFPVEFAAKIAKYQYRAGKGFLLERPKGTGEDKEKEMMSLTKLPNVQTVSVDMCEHGLRVRLRDGSQTNLVRHASTIVTNVPEIAEAIQRRCSGLHKHHVLEGSFQTQQATKYTDGFGDAIITQRSEEVLPKERQR